MKKYVFSFNEVSKKDHLLVGGKGAALGELSKIEGLQVPDGFCISTDAFKEITSNEAFNSLLTQLSLLRVNDREAIIKCSSNIQRLIEDTIIPDEINNEILENLQKFEENSSYAVRSSATAEDLPIASFAGQLDSYLNITGKQSVLNYIKKCWASLFTERAIIYRIQNDFDHRHVYISVVIQKMVFPEVSGIMFTADPVTGNREIVSIDAGYGLGEALVSGLVSADNYKVKDGEVINKKISTKKIAIIALEGAGTEKQEVESNLQTRQVLTEKQILNLEHIGRKLEQHFGCPQDIEWCVEKKNIFIVQSRPITTLFPVPHSVESGKKVFISTGHQQMMTDAIKPLGISIWQLRALRPFHEAASRLFVDVTGQLKTEKGANAFLKAMGDHDPLIKDALLTVLKRGWISTETASYNLTPFLPSEEARLPEVKDPNIVTELVHEGQKKISELKEKIALVSGCELFDFIKKDCEEKSRNSLANAKVLEAIYTGINTSLWINVKIEEWLGETNVADTLSQAMLNNITSEMGMDLLKLADIIRPYDEVVQYLQKNRTDDFLKDILSLKGGIESKRAIEVFLDTYGMRCVGEIDITRDRWSEKPAALIPILLSNITSFQPGEADRRFRAGKLASLNKEKEILERLSGLPDGERKVLETKMMIQQLRDFAGYREYPKYEMVNHFFIYKQALMAEADKLLENNLIQFREDVFYLTFDEFKNAVCNQIVNQEIINQRKINFRFHEKLNPPRVITSEGEIIVGQYHKEDQPENSLVGLPVSGGVVEGKAKVLKNFSEAKLGTDDILVTTFTDPSWTPMFLSIKGLITEVGGLMTHGAVIAREYGLPAVVGVVDATNIIKDGQRIRINGTSGYIELL
ncbi:MAG TPA: phosphoenolpyruvate synthase [Chryseobacterium sp.]|nr:phosphoenolpyruvate synthase [Chryseobacterium sp.]